MKGILLAGHGSRSQEAVDTFNSIAEKLSRKVDYPLCGAHMEFAEPDIKMGAEELVKLGVNEIYILPLFLYSGIHLKEDIPSIIDELKGIYPFVSFTLCAPLGDDDLIVDILLKRLP